jgi:hypothetical protein
MVQTEPISTLSKLNFGALHFARQVLPSRTEIYHLPYAAWSESASLMLVVEYNPRYQQNLHLQPSSVLSATLLLFLLAMTTAEPTKPEVHHAASIGTARNVCGTQPCDQTVMSN